jgi:hypothetical protein
LDESLQALALSDRHPRLTRIDERPHDAKVVGSRIEGNRGGLILNRILLMFRTHPNILGGTAQ